MLYSRRQIGKLALGVPAAALRPSSLFAQSKPNSKWGGVQVGIIAPYAFQGTASTAEDILKGMLVLGIDAVELQNDPVERFAGAPAMGGRGRGPGGPGAAGGPGRAGGPGAAGGPGGRQGGGRAEPTPEQQAEQRARAEALKAWRLSAPMDKYAELRRMYNDAGVHIYGFKLALTESMSDAEYDYTFNVAKALGANQVTMEMPNKNPALTRRIGEFAAKHRIMVGYHQHTQATFTLWDEAVSQSKYNGINLDIGHYVAGTSESPIPLIEKHHDRITSIHLKDRKKDNGANLPWGEGDTPIREVLQLMKKNKYTFPATIELEYRVEGSNPMTELRRCVEFCRNALGAS
jgi:sugar phosphate isomerase/epimerase